MNPKIQVLLGFVVLATAQSVPISTLHGGLRGIGFDDDVLTERLTGGDIFNRYMTNDVFDVDRYVLKKLVKLDIVNRPLVKKLLLLDIVERKVIGDLARGINEVTIKKGKLYPLTLWDRVLKIKGYNMGVNRNIEDRLVETEIEEREILRDLIKVDNIDHQLVTHLLFTDIVERKVIADVAHIVNEITLKRGRDYPIVLLDKVLKINGGIHRGFNTLRFGDDDLGFVNNRLGLGVDRLGLGLGITNRRFGLDDINEFDNTHFTDRFGLRNDLTRTFGVDRLLL